MNFQPINNNFRNPYYNFNPVGNQEKIDEAEILLQTASDTLNRWESLSNRLALTDRISLNTFKKMQDFVDTHFGFSENTVFLSSSFFERIRVLKISFQDLLIRSMQSLIESPELPDKSKAQQFLNMAMECLDSKGCLSNEFETGLTKAVIQLKARMENNTLAISALPANNNYSEIVPEEIHLLFMQFLNAKDVCHMAQVSTKYYTRAQSEQIWEHLCLKNPEVDSTQIPSHKGKLKEFYKEETDLKKFKSTGTCFFKTHRGKNLIVNLNVSHPDLRGKHVYSIVKKELKKGAPANGYLETDKIILISAGQLVHPETEIKPLKWQTMECVHLLYNPPKLKN